MSKEAYKLFFIYSKDGKEYINTCLGYKELCEFLGRDKNSVSNTIWKMNKGKLNHIRDYEGKTYMLITEEDLIGGKNVKKNRHRV